MAILFLVFSETRGNKGIRRGGPSGIDYANFKEEKFSYLNVTALSKIVVKQSSLCAFACLETLSCFSFNVAAFLDNGKLLCELLASEKYNNRDKFIPSDSFHHFSIAVSSVFLQKKKKKLVAFPKVPPTNVPCTGFDSQTRRHLLVLVSAPRGFSPGTPDLLTNQ